MAAAPSSDFAFSPSNFSKASANTKRFSSVGNSTYGWDSTTDGAKLIKNALLFTIPPLTLTTSKKTTLPDAAEVYPTHGFGSFCSYHGTTTSLASGPGR